MKRKIPGFTTHPAEWRIWRAMRSRCNPKLKGNKNTKRYTSRGITVCEEWNNPDTGFSAFIQDMGPRPSEKYSIDRIDNCRGYFPDNCRWATQKEQAGNTCTNVLVRVGEETVPISEAARRVGVNRQTIANRISAGKAGDEVFAPSPVHKLTFSGKTQSARKWAIELGIPITTIYNRLKKGLPVTEVLCPHRKSGKYIRVVGKRYGRGIKKC